MGVAAACELGAAPLGQPLGVPDGEVGSSKQRFAAVRQRLAAPAENDLACVAVADSRLDPSGRVALRCNRVQERQPRVVDGAGGLDQLFSPGDRLKGLDPPHAEQPRIGGEGGGDIQIAVVCGPSKRGAQIGQLYREPVVGIPLVGAVPQGQDVGFASGEVAGVGGPNLRCFAAGNQLFLGELADRFQHRKPGPSRRPVSDQQRLAH